MADMSKISPDSGVTIYNLKDANARANKWDNAGQKIAGAYNILPNNGSSITYTSGSDSLTFTKNADGSVTVNGKYPSNATFAIYGDWSDIVDENHTYKLVGCPSGGSTSTYYLTAYNIGRDTGSGYEFTPPTPVSGQARSVEIMVIANTIMNNITFKPMITTDLNASYSDYVPHIETNTELKAEIDSLNTKKMNELVVRRKDFDITIPTTQYYGQLQVNVAESGYSLFAPLYAAANRGTDQVDFFVAKSTSTIVTVTVVTLNRQNPPSSISINAGLTYIMAKN